MQKAKNSKSQKVFDFSAFRLFDFSFFLTFRAEISWNGNFSTFRGRKSWFSRCDRYQPEEHTAHCGTICMEEQPKGLEIEAAFSCMFKKWLTSNSACPVFCTSDWIPISSKNSPGKCSCFCYIQRFNFWPFRKSRKELLNHITTDFSRRGITCWLSSGQFWLQAAIAMEENISRHNDSYDKNTNVMAPRPRRKKKKSPPPIPPDVRKWQKLKQKKRWFGFNP